MTQAGHPLLDRLLRRVGASIDEPPSPEAWRSLCELIARTYREADQDRYTIERAMEISSQEMQDLYQELRQSAEHELASVRQSDERHRLLFDANPLPMWVLDADTLQFLDVNPAMVTTYGYSRDELLGMRATDIRLPEDIPAMMAAVRGSREDTVQYVGLHKHRRRDGSVIEVEITVHGLIYDGRRGVLGIAVDKTEARRIEDQLRQAQKMEAIGRLAGGVAHDFNNILAVILTNAEFVLDEIGEGNPGAGGIVEIQEAASRAAGLTRQLLTFSRKQRRQPKPLGLNSIVTGIEAMLSRMVGEDITMSAVIAPDLGTIEADPGEVEQVLMNLVVNARDAMPTGGRLVLETSNVVVDALHGAQLGIGAGRYVLLSVSDNGCGMTEEIRSRIFEPFFTTKDVDRGTGLGLATVFGIVNACGGGISVYSEPGRGSTFRVYWPRVDARPLKTIDQRSAPRRGSGTILVVEDDHQLRKILSQCLTSWGYRVLEATAGTAALEILHTHPGSIDLLLTDLVMPGGLDGRELSRCVLAERPQIKVILMSGYTEHAALNAAALGPCNDFVQKPFSGPRLSETIYRVLAS
jgi:two-component system, cell cycle sensor histidine kinase and response regulator CckA